MTTCSTIQSGRLHEKRSVITNSERYVFGENQPYNSHNTSKQITQHIISLNNCSILATPYLTCIPYNVPCATGVQLIQQLTHNHKIDIGRLYELSNLATSHPLHQLLYNNDHHHNKSILADIPNIVLPLMDRSSSTLHNNNMRHTKLIVDVGCGYGEFITNHALTNPNNYYIGVERITKRAVRGLTRYHMLHRLNDHTVHSNNNFYMFNTDATLLLKHVMPHNCIDILYINYIDTYIKRRHSKHRLVNQEFIDILAHVMVHNTGIINIVSDHLDTINNITQLFRATPYFTSTYNHTYRIDSDISSEQRIVTSYGKVWNNRGLTSYYLQYVRNNKPIAVG